MYPSSGENVFGLPNLGFGLGLRHAHYDAILNHHPPVDWFEIISEDFMDAHHGHWEFLADLKDTYPLVMHGVSMSIGSPDALNISYLHKLKKLADFIDAPWVSDHICWTGVHGINTHDLMPVPYTEEALAHFIARVQKVQDILQRPLLLENPSTYLSYTASTMPEYEFISRLAEASGSGILLDINNIYVSAFNHRYDAHTYLNALPANRVVQIHLAGHLHKGTHIIDTHDRPVANEVWDLYAHALQRMGPKTTMVEWDSQIPEFQVLLEQLQQARKIAAQAPESNAP